MEGLPIVAGPAFPDAAAAPAAAAAAPSSAPQSPGAPAQDAAAAPMPAAIADAPSPDPAAVLADMKNLPPNVRYAPAAAPLDLEGIKFDRRA